jgi:WD40 repeat protein
MFTSSLDKTIRVWTISTGSVIKTIKSPAIFDEPILCMSLHNSAIAIGGSGGSIQVGCGRVPVYRVVYLSAYYAQLR